MKLNADSGYHRRPRHRPLLPPDPRLIMYSALNSQPGAIEASSTVASALSVLSDDACASLPSAEDSIANCADRVFEALRDRDRRAISAWVKREKHPASDSEVLAIFDSVANAVALQAGDVKKLRSTLTFLGELRAEVSDDLSKIGSNQRIDEMSTPEIHAVAAGLLSAIEAYDQDTAEHLRATAKLARRVAETMQLDDRQIADIELAALLHDIGKIAVPIAVLQKSGALTESEWVTMRKHPGTGADMLERVEKLKHVAHIVRSHHERMDGMGYPDRMPGAEVPLEARIVAVADAFHAMVTKRSYREAINPKAALDILHANRGTQFDGDVVDAICENFNYMPRKIIERTFQEVRRGA